MNIQTEYLTLSHVSHKIFKQKRTIFWNGFRLLIDQTLVSKYETNVINDISRKI